MGLFVARFVTIEIHVIIYKKLTNSSGVNCHRSIKSASFGSPKSLRLCENDLTSFYHVTNIKCT